MCNVHRIATLTVLTLTLLCAPFTPRLSSIAVAGDCLGSDAGSASPEAREVSCLRELAARAKRVGNVLTLKLNDGSTKTFRSNPDACKNDDARKCVVYRLVGFHAAAERYLVYVTGYEDFECRLVSARTGRATRLLNIPRFAPDGSTFFVTGHDPAYDTWISIGSVSSDPPSLSWKRGPFVEAWEFVRWINNDDVALHNTTKTESCPSGDCDAILRRSGTGWTLEGPSRTRP